MFPGVLGTVETALRLRHEDVCRARRLPVRVVPDPNGGDVNQQPTGTTLSGTNERGIAMYTTGRPGVWHILVRPLVLE